MNNSKLSSKVKKLTLFSASIPVLMMTLINTVSAPINTFVSSGVNKSSVESVGTAGSILFLFGVLVSLVVGGSTIVIGQYIGAKGKEKDLKRATHTTFYLMIIISIFLVVIALSLSRILLKSFGLKSQRSLEDGQLYILMIAPMQIFGVCQQYFIGTLAIYGHPRHSLYIGISVTFGDILLSSLFVYVAHLGIFGVILGTMIARFVGFIASIVIYSLVLEPVWKIKEFDWKTAKKIMLISFPIAGERVNYNATMFVLAIIIGNIAGNIGMVKYGHNYMIWARAIFNSTTAIVLIGGVSFSVGLERVLSREYGKNNIDGTSKIVWKAFWIAVSIDLPMVLILFFVQGYIIDFMTSRELNKDATKLLKNILFWSYAWLALLELGRVSNLVFIAATRSAGDTKLTAIFSIGTSWFVCVLFSWVLAGPAGLGWQGVVIAMAADECVRGLFNFIRYKRGKWKKYIQKISGDIGKEKNEKYNTTQG